jgi:hypothetical protein
VQTSLARYSRLLLLPIARRTLHLVEVLANLADPWLVAFLAGLILFPLGMVIGGRAASAIVVLVASLELLALFAIAGALTSFLVAWLLRNRRRGEAFTLVFVLGISMLSFIPAAMSSRLDRRTPGPFSIEAFDRALPRWSRYVPSEAYSRAVDDELAGNRGSALFGVGVLLVESLVLFVASSNVHRRLVDSVEMKQGWRRHSAAVAIVRRWPGLGPPASAIATAQVRNALRSIRGRLVVLLPGPIVAMLTMAFGRIPGEGWPVALSTHGYLLLGAGLLFAIYAMQPFTMNLFGADRGGLSLSLLSPVSDAELAIGKVAGCAALFSVAAGLALIVALLMAPGGSPWLWLATVATGYATLAFVSPVGVLMSALFPLASDLSKTGPGGNPHPVPLLAGSLLTMAIAAPMGLAIVRSGPTGLAPVAVCGVAIMWLVVALGVATVFVPLAARVVSARRENLALVAAR